MICRWMIQKQLFLEHLTSAIFGRALAHLKSGPAATYLNAITPNNPFASLFGPAVK